MMPSDESKTCEPTGIDLIPFPSMFLEMYHFLKNDNILFSQLELPSW